MAASPGFRCECDAGYGIVPSAAGGGKCEDINECELFPTLCNRGDLSRNACLNTDGAFECEEDLPDQCTAENNFGECWNEEVGSVTVTSCVVRVSPSLQVRFRTENFQLSLGIEPIMLCQIRFSDLAPG